MIKFKKIIAKENNFIYRFNLYLKKGSIKLHLICSDDTREPHNHPWDFKSLILFGGYKEFNEKGVQTNFRFLSVNKKDTSVFHRLELYKLLGIKIPCLTIGRYSEKKQTFTFFKT